MKTRYGVFLVLPLLGVWGCAANGSPAAAVPPSAPLGDVDAGGASPPNPPTASAASDPPGAPGSADPSSCGGNDVDLVAVLSNRRCRPSRDAPATPASAASDVKVTLVASTSAVAPGGHVDLTLAIVNVGAAPIPLYFSGDLALGVEVRDDSGARLAPPAGNAPKNADPRCAQVDCRLPESHVVLAPGAKAHATLAWDATRKAWPATGPTTCCTRHVDAVSSGPLPDGTYHLKVPLPYETNHGNPADPEIAIRVGR